ncbi:CRISPR-associated endonuclease Cas2 [Stieleria sp. TO1_6]|uniref:CRISPR-associated endonuclease Cas2 n=1 Tax=Stieleria tagensis TaxID=2956795 RepID=UPI00209B22E2|nr:CRISPR-associated endonuclease Cas2 [Stieleria tagensis]MCO8124952.1 CRISPR-associated endonuclease Cas2 [Stieleria tagensis]
MHVLVTYDVSTVNPAGKRRLRRVAKTCLDFGQRVQNSVFELNVDPAQWAECRKRLIETCEPTEDSLRFYQLGNDYSSKVEHVGNHPSLDTEGPLII